MKATILLLVSDPLVRSVLQETLQRDGHMVLGTADLGQAVDRLKEVNPDLLILPNHVLSMPGHEAAKYLRTKCTKMRVLMLGGHLADDRLRNRAELQGFEVFPIYSAAELLHKVRETLSKPRG